MRVFLENLFVPFEKEKDVREYQDFELFDIGIVLVLQDYLRSQEQKTITSKYAWEDYK